MSDEKATLKKLPGIQMPLNISAELAKLGACKVIGSNNGEQVELAMFCTLHCSAPEGGACARRTKTN